MFLFARCDNAAPCAWTAGEAVAKKKTYSDEDKANAMTALAANGGNVSLTATQLGIPKQTIHHWVKHGTAPQPSDAKKSDLAAKLDEVAHQLADAMPGKIEKAGLQQVAVSLGITIEKARLLRDQPTSITQPPLPLDLGKLTDEQLSQLHAILVAQGLPVPPGT